MEQNSKTTAKGRLNGSSSTRIDRSKPSLLVTYRIPLIDIDTLDLLPIHFLVDPGIEFQWPIDEELSDEKIHLHGNAGEHRLGILEKYLNLSKESIPFQSFNSPNAHHDDAPPPPPVENSPTPSAYLEPVSESNATIPPTPSKKGSRPSFNSFSKIIRRTFIQPFSSAKRLSLKLATAATATARTAAATSESRDVRSVGDQ